MLDNEYITNLKCGFEAKVNEIRAENLELTTKVKEASNAAVEAQNQIKTNQKDNDE
jgi:hypothetical protein